MVTARPAALTALVGAYTGYALAQPNNLTRVLAIAFTAGYFGAHLIAVRDERRRHQATVRWFGTNRTSQQRRS